MRFSQFIRSNPNTLDEIVSRQRKQIEELKKRVNHQQDDDPDALAVDETSWVIQQSYEMLNMNYSEQMVILFVICQLPNGIFETDLHEIFHARNPRWKDFLKVLMKQQKQQEAFEEKKDDASSDNDQETSWLITSEHIEEIDKKRYYAYQIVYNYINKSIMNAAQKLDANMTVVTHLSNISRKIMRSIKCTDIKLLSLAKFTAAIDVGMWSDDPDFVNPKVYYQSYEDLYEDPKVYFSYHEPNFQKFLDLEYLIQVFPVKRKFIILVESFRFQS